MTLLRLLRRGHAKLEYWIERLEEAQPNAPCDSLVAADVARLSRHIYEYNKTASPYLDMVNKDNPFPNGDRLTKMTPADYYPDLVEGRCSICGEKMKNCPNNGAVKE